MGTGNLMTYSAITTKIKAMRSNLLSKENFAELASCPTVADAFSYLQNTPSYSKLFSSLNPSDVHRGQIEWLLNFSTYEDFSKIFHFAGERQRRFLNLYFTRYEILTLKKYIRHILDPRHNTPYSIIENDFEKHSSINTKLVAESGNMDEFVINLTGSEYYNCMKKVHDNIPNASLFDYEMALDMYYFTSMWKSKDKIFSTAERNFIEHSYGSRIDLLNALWIYRCDSYYSVPDATIYSFLIPVTYKLKKSEIKQMVEVTDTKADLAILQTTYYGRRYGFTADRPLEEQCNDIITGIVLKDFRQSPYSLAAINAYFHLKNEETAKIITALECIRYGYAPELVLKYINRKGSGV